MRGWRPAAVLTVFLAALSIVMVLAYQRVARASSERDEPLALRLGALGRASFGWTVVVLCVLLVLVIPSITAASIAGERDRQTLVPLQVSRLGPWRILVGKLWASLCYVLVLLVAAAPILAIPVLVGGVTAGQVVRAVVGVVTVTVLLAALGVAVSALCRRTQSAALVSSVLVLLLVGGTLVGWGAVQALAYDPGESRRSSDILLVANPLVGLADFVRGDRVGSVNLDRPIELLARSVAYRIDVPEPRDDAPAAGGAGPGVFFNGPVAAVQTAPQQSPNRQPLFGFRVGATSERKGLPFWVWSLIAQVVLVGALLALAARRLRIPRRRPT